MNETTATCLHTIHKALLSLIMTEGIMYERHLAMNYHTEHYVGFSIAMNYLVSSAMLGHQVSITHSVVVVGIAMK